MLTKSKCADAVHKNLLPVVALAAVLAGEIAGSMRVAAEQTSEPIYRG